MTDFMRLVQGAAIRAPGFRTRRYCNICRRHAAFFYKFGHESDVFQELNIIGGGVRKDCECPYCRSHDRFRWSFHLIERYTNILKGRCTVLQIAPEHQIANRIEQNRQCQYYTGDIMPGRAKYVVDITNIPFEDGKFDYIIMNHVLEHIPDEARAISELKRCLKPNGTLILSYPVCSDQKTFEDARIVSAEDRLRYYGQMDHCRLYGTDCRDHLEQYELEVTPYIVKELLDSKTIRKMALIPDDIAFFCTKK